MALSWGLADTSLFIAREAGRPLHANLPDSLAVSIITIGELRAGVLAAPDTSTLDRRLATLEAAQKLRPAPVDAGVAVAWARLRNILRDKGLRMGVNDSWIAATAMDLGIPIVTQDAGFPELAELEVIRA